jgi:hypothetical protein
MHIFGIQITSRFDGTIEALHYAVDDMAIVGKVRCISR